MDLLNRYLQAVKKHLPWKRQDDIIAELRANLEAQLEDKETELGRPLNASEAEAWLKQIGPPIQVAGRYLPQRYLIGPVLFPTYWYVLQLVILWSAVIFSIVSAIQIFTAPNPDAGVVLEAVLRIPGVLFTSATWVTLVFAAIEFAMAYYPETFQGVAAQSVEWSPGSLPAIENESFPGTRRRRYPEAVGEVIFGFLLLVWLLLVPYYPFLLMGPGVAFLYASPFQIAPVWMQFFWWVVALNVFQLGLRSIDLVRGTWQSVWPWRQVVEKIFGLIPLVLLINAPGRVYVTLKHPALDEAHFGATANTINQSVFRGLLIVCCIIVLQLVWKAGTLTFNHFRESTRPVA